MSNWKFNAIQSHFVHFHRTFVITLYCNKIVLLLVFDGFNKGFQEQMFAILFVVGIFLLLEFSTVERKDAKQALSHYSYAIVNL